ncbi:MAG: hypothetical protein PUA90_02015 [bacterium]|nr:hypothetical protein [bacterium]
MQKSELIEIKGGAGSISATALNAVIRAISLSLELGRIVGSAIRRKFGGKCSC